MDAPSVRQICMKAIFRQQQQQWTGDTSSPNAEIKMAIQNDKSPRIPLTGGQGMVVMLVAGVGLVVGGTYIAKKKKEDSVAC